MLVFGPLTDIFIIIYILIQSLLFLCVCTHSCSTDDILVILGHLIRNVIGIFIHSWDHDVHFCGYGIGSGIFSAPTLLVSVISALDVFDSKLVTILSSMVASSFSATPILSLLSLAFSYSASNFSTALSVLSLCSSHELSYLSLGYSRP